MRNTASQLYAWRRALALSLVWAVCWPMASLAQTSSHGRLPLGPSGQVAAQGRIVPVGEVIRVAATPGANGEAIVDQLLVKSGDTVEQGQLLAILHGRDLLQAQVAAAGRDKTLAEAALAEAQAAQAHGLAEMQVQLADLEGRAGLADANFRHAVDASQTALDQAKLEMASAQTAFAHAKLSQQTGQAVSAANVTTVQAQLDAVPRLGAAERKVVAAQLEEAKAAKLNSDGQQAAQVDQAQAQVDLAMLHTRQVEAYLIDPSADAAKLAPVQVEDRLAFAAVEAQHKLMDAAQAASAASVATAQARVDSAFAALAVAQAQLVLSEVHAPSAGTILSVLSHPGEAVGPTGLLQMGDLSKIYVDALVLVDDIPGVHVGQKAQIFGSALPAEGLGGQVTNISSFVGGNTLINPDPTAFSDTDQKVVLVKIQLDNAGRAASLIYGQVTVQFVP